MSNIPINILYVDDEIHNLTAFQATFRRVFNVYLAESAKDGLSILKKEDIHIIITDQRMPGMTGIEFLASILIDYPDPIRFLLTGYSDLNAVIDAINVGQVYLYATKPWMEEELKNNIIRAFEVFSLRKENKVLNDQLSIVNGQLEFMLTQKLLS
ncbi:MAG: response regulator [Pedobacter sp.]